MIMFLTILGASALGTFCGNVVLFWVIGAMAKRQEKKQQEEMQKLQQDYLEMVKRERARIENYAKMEG